METKINIKRSKNAKMAQSAFFKNCKNKYWQEVLQVNQPPFQNVIKCPKSLIKIQ